MPGKNILIFFPYNFTDVKSGIQRRFEALFYYLTNRGFILDLITLKNFGNYWSGEIEPIGIPGVRNLYLYDHSKGLKTSFIKNFLSLRFSENRTLFGNQITHLPDYAFTGLRKMFAKIVRHKSYDHVLISYVQWANLIKGIDSLHGKTILTMEDCLSRNIAENHPGMVSVDQLMPMETELVNMFDKVICLSWEEMDYFSKHTTKPEFHYVPVFMDKVESVPGDPKIYDILFVGSENPSNQRGMKWFFNAVFPLLNKELKILCVGKITDFVPEFENVLKLKYVANLEDVYQKSFLTFNPLQDGTGMKVKVIESLAYGIPIVSTTIGLSGIKPEVKKLFITADEPWAFAQAIHGLIRDKTLYLEYSKVLKKVFRENFATEVAVKELDKVFCI